MIEHAGGKPGFLELAVREAQRADPAQVGVLGPDRPAAEHDAGIGRVVGDGVEDLARRLGLGSTRSMRVSRISSAGTTKSVALSTSNIVQSGPARRCLHDEGELGLDARGDEAIRGHEPAIGKEHVVEQHAGIRLVDIERALHRLRGQADLVAFDDAALGDLDLDPCLLDRVGVVDGDAG